MRLTLQMWDRAQTIPAAPKASMWSDIEALVASHLSRLSEDDDPPDYVMPVAPGFAGALDGLRDRAALKGPKHGAYQARADREGAHPDILAFERRFVRRCAELGIPVFAHSVVRDEDEQTRLYVKGRTRAKYGQSPHNFGLAVDLVHSRKAWSLTKDEWALLGHIGKEVAKALGIPVDWGGDWNFYDPAHWQIAKWRGLRDGYPYP